MAGQYVGRCGRCGGALWVAGTTLYTIAAGHSVAHCGPFKRAHKRRDW